MKVADLLRYIDTFAPMKIAEPWDNSGLMVGDRDWMVSKIGLALDPSLDSVEKAISRDCDCLVVHHPLIFSPLKAIDLSTPIARIIEKALAHKLTIISMHTNWDKADRGVNTQLAKTFLREDFSALITDENKVELGAWGWLKTPCSLRELMVFLKKEWNLTWITAYGDVDRVIHKAALCGGSGGDLWENALEKSVDVYITADMKYHQILDICALGMALCVVDHGEMERYSLRALKDIFEKQGVSVEIVRENGPDRLQIE